MIDAHAHLVQAPPPCDVEAWVIPGVHGAADALDDPRCVAAVGLHPWHLPDSERALDDALAALDPGSAIAIGETGLDKGRRGGPMELQRRAFRHQLRLAAENDLPLILHVVRTHGACLAEIRDAERDTGASLRGMVHDFGGPTEVVRGWVDAGFFLSVSPRGLDRPAAIRAIPGERLLIETDDEGWEKLPHVCAEVARIRGLLPEDVAAITAENARRLFRFGRDGSIFPA